jgi:hypothetical protein
MPPLVLSDGIGRPTAMERLPLGDTPYFSIYFRDCILAADH